MIGENRNKNGSSVCACTKTQQDMYTSHTIVCTQLEILMKTVTNCSTWGGGGIRFPNHSSKYREPMNVAVGIAVSGYKYVDETGWFKDERIYFIAC